MKIFVAAKTQKYSKNLNYFKIRCYTGISNKLNDAHVFHKVNWSIFKMFLNNKKNFDYSTFGFTKKTELFNSFFAKQCTVIKTAAVCCLSPCLKQTFFCQI